MTLRFIRSFIMCFRSCSQSFRVNNLKLEHMIHKYFSNDENTLIKVEVVALNSASTFV